MVCGVTRTGEFFDMGRYLASGIGWTWEVHQTWCLHYDYGLMWKCHYTIVLRIFCRSLRLTHCILGFISLLSVPRFLCIDRPQIQKLEIISRTEKAFP